jgi:hypothetical protein
MIGDVMGLLEEANRLQQVNPQLLAFTQQIVLLAKDFQTEKICELVKSYM